MAEPILVPNLGDVVTPNGISSIEFHTWMDQITNAANNSMPAVGAASPEGVIIASAGKWYVDTAATVGEGIYFKESGEGDTGWVLRS